MVPPCGDSTCMQDHSWTMPWRHVSRAAGHVIVGEIACSNPDPAHSGAHTPIKIYTEETDVVNLGPTTTYRPRIGDIGLVRISGVGGRVIRGLQWADGCGFEDYEHALGVVANDPLGDSGPLIVEAEPGGAVRVPLHYTGVRWLVCPNEHRSEMAHYLNLCADNKIGYSWLDYAAVGAHRFRLPVPHLQKYVKTSGHMMCSQLVDWCASQAGWHLFDDGRWEGFVPPCDLNKLWHKHYALHNGTAY